MTILGSHRKAHRDIPYSCSIFFNFHRNKVLNFFVFFYPRGSVRSPDAKRTQRLGPNVSLTEVKHEVKPTSMIKRLNISFTSFTPDFLCTKKFQNQILYKHFTGFHGFEICCCLQQLKSVFTPDKTIVHLALCTTALLLI